MLTSIFATTLAGMPCGQDSDCALMGQTGWRCMGDPTAPLPAGNCFQGWGHHTNSTCSCQEDSCGTYTNVTAPPAGSTKYLMIGDSVSMGMEKDVAATLLPHNWYTIHNPGNAANANKGWHCMTNFTTVPNVTAPFDVISYNFGLHGIAKDIEMLSTSNYTSLITSITDFLLDYKKAHGTKLLWVTTTPVPNDPVWTEDGPCNVTSQCIFPARFNSDVVEFNKIAQEIVDKAGIPTLDLYTFVVNKCGGPGYKTCDGFQLPHNVHYTAEGWTALASQMSAALLKL
eukprot:TRINITY_DN2917_c0_g1_i1.p1 TRINITY_DN2917_c0_g1~~TRINITY_DN2917_c0_g1_i1.p1  ORF type:complete len:285 (+),score=47.31 TRINITY_DN2917_c0_g1_i1:163-1017(+)